MGLCNYTTKVRTKFWLPSHLCPWAVRYNPRRGVLQQHSGRTSCGTGSHSSYLSSVPSVRALQPQARCPPTTPPAAPVAALVPTRLTSPPCLMSIALSDANPTQFLTGGNDGIVQLYDKSTYKVLASLKGHSKKFHQVTFHERKG